MIPRITNALGGVLTSTFEKAVRSGLGKEGIGLDTVIDYLTGAYTANDAELYRFLRLYELAYDGINNKEIWAKVIFDIMQELFSPPERLISLLPKGIPINRGDAGNLAFGGAKNYSDPCSDSTEG
jgi:hypothetical protein